MPVGMGLGRGPEPAEPGEALGLPRMRGVHSGALWLAAAAPVLATLLLLARLAA